MMEKTRNAHKILVGKALHIRMRVWRIVLDGSWEYGLWTSVSAVLG
jgi:hypothetical protein